MKNFPGKPRSKRCPDCGKEKPLEEFPRHYATKTGRATYCKPCHNTRTRSSIKRLYGDTRHYHYRERFGIGADEVAQLIRDQNGLCAVCGENPAKEVDHDHRTGKVRGILCPSCNGGLGAFRDDPAIIERAILYLEEGVV